MTLIIIMTITGGHREIEASAYEADAIAEREALNEQSIVVTVEDGTYRLVSSTGDYTTLDSSALINLGIA